MSAKQSPLIFQKWATFFAGRKPGDVITPDDMNHAKRIVWHAKSHGFGAMIRSTESGKPMVHLTRLTPALSAVPEAMRPPTQIQATPKPTVELPLRPTETRNDLWEKIQERAKNAYGVFWKDNQDNVDYEPWDVVMTHNACVLIRMRWLSVGAYIVSLGGAK